MVDEVDEVCVDMVDEPCRAGDWARAVELYSATLEAEGWPATLEAEGWPAPRLPGSKKACVTALVGRALALLKLGEWERALADAKAARRLDPTSVLAWYRCGLAEGALGRF